MDFGDVLIAVTVRVAVVTYVLRIVVEMTMGREDAGQKASRMLWTLGLGSYIVHVLCAFHFEHDWSHSDAYEHTVCVTLDKVGWNTGIGLYFNYLFTLLWLADVIIWWKRPELRTPKVFWVLHAIYFFMIFNATVVFGPPVWGVLAIMTFPCLFCIWLICQLTEESP
ncbi:MAG: hypothetical protein CMJ78_26695 [Planctomycetaceae bacterium]|nr:hypothetical protein [Planctomycetaceae bacterium]